ncbi:MAG: hypothetical protein AAF958_06805 [Planctomycetota bacterium]
MTRRSTRWFAVCSLTACLLVAVAGCGVDDPGTPIPGAASITEAVEALTLMPPGSEPDSVQLRGRIGANSLEPFERDRAAFMLSEIIEDPNAGEGHDPSTCPFCKRRAEKAPKAYVVLLDDSGQPIPRPADVAFGWDEGDVIQVSGTATFDKDLNTVKIEATKYFKE